MMTICLSKTAEQLFLLQCESEVLKDMKVLNIRRESTIQIAGKAYPRDSFTCGEHQARA